MNINKIIKYIYFLYISSTTTKFRYSLSYRLDLSFYRRDINCLLSIKFQTGKKNRKPVVSIDGNCGIWTIILTILHTQFIYALSTKKEELFLYVIKKDRKFIVVLKIY